MRDQRFAALLVALVLYTSLSLSRCSVDQNFESARDSQKVKANDRRAAGLVPYPRIGRNSEMSNFPRSDRATGLVHYPRVGRSDPPLLNMNVNRYHDMIPDADVEFYTGRDIDPEVLLDLDYEGYLLGKPAPFRSADRMLRNGGWLTPDHVRGAKEFHLAQKIDDPRLLYPVSRESRNGEGQSIMNGYTPRLGRETDHDVTMSFV